MKRKLTLVEGTMYGDGKTAVNAVAAVKIKGNIRLDELHIALCKIQARHPLLKVNVLEDAAGVPYFMTSENISGIPVRVAERYTDEDWKKETTFECITAFNAKNGPLMRVVYLNSPAASDLIMVCHHCICDGRGILNLLDETFRLLAQPQLEIGTYESFNSLHDFIPDAVKRSKKNLLIVFAVKKLTKLMLLIISSKKEIERSKPYLLHWKLDQKISALIFEKCKEEAASINAFLSIVFLKAFDSFTSFKSYGKLYCAADIRKFVPEIQNDMLFAFPATIGLSFKKKGKLVFWDQVRLFKDKLTLEINKINVNRIFMLSDYLSSLGPKLAKYAKSDAGAHDFTFSNMGRVGIKERYGPIEIEKLYSPVTIFPFGNPSALFASAFKGQLDFIITSDEYFLKYEEATGLKEQAMRILKEMTGVPEIYS